MSWTTFDNPGADAHQVQAYAGVLDAVHAFHDALASAAPGAELLDELAGDLRRWADVLTPMAVPELERLSGRLRSLPVRGHLAIPPILVDQQDGERIEATVTFGEFYLGGGAAAHGGTIMTVFDELLGRASTIGGRKPARTAYLKTDFRSVVPIGVPMRVVAWLAKEDGRKRFMRGEMWDGATLCAEVDSLFVELRDGAA